MRSVGSKSAVVSELHIVSVCVCVCVCVCVHVYVCGGGGGRYKNMEGNIYLFVVLVPYVYFLHILSIHKLWRYICTLYST